MTPEKLEEIEKELDGKTISRDQIYQTYRYVRPLIAALREAWGIQKLSASNEPQVCGAASASGRVHCVLLKGHEAPHSSQIEDREE